MPYADDGGNSWNGTKCVPIAPNPNAEGEPCTVEGNGVSGIDDCDGTSMCWNVDPDTNMGTCHHFCIGSDADPGCPNACDACSISGDGVLTICFATCDPLGTDCEEGEACYPVNHAFVCAPTVQDKSGEFPQRCEYVNACDSGFACINAAMVPGCDGAGCCAPFCSLAVPDTCDTIIPGTVCTPYFEDEPGGCTPTGIGICVAPE